MPKLTKRLTDTVALSLAPPAEGYEIYWCRDSDGFGLRVTSTGARSWITERRVDGKTTRRTLGKASGRNAISANAARVLQLDVSSELAKGIDRSAERRERAKKDKAEAVTLAEALREYVAKKRRAKDGLPLKQRTVADYLRMLESGRVKLDGTPTLDGELYQLAEKSIYKITAGDIRQLHAALSKRGTAGRRADYALQVLRAVLNHNGIKIEGNPLSRDTAGKDRIRIAPPRAKGEPIPADLIGAWWRAATAVDGLAADVLRFMLLTGARGVEVRSILLRDFDQSAGKVTLRDTKARNDHVIFLSTQAAEIVARNAKGKRADDALFPLGDPGKTLAAINRAAGVEGVAPHGVRKTFASLAADILPGAMVKRLMNHVDASDTTAVHYVRQSESNLRAAWQTVAAFVVSEALKS